VLRRVQQRRECRYILGTKLQSFIRMPEPHRLKIIDSAQQRGAGNEIIGYAVSSLPAGGQHHRREMRTRGAAAHMNTHRVAAKITRVRVKPGDRRAALAHNFGEGACGASASDCHHARSSLGEVFSHEAGIGTTEQAPHTPCRNTKIGAGPLTAAGKMSSVSGSLAP